MYSISDWAILNDTNSQQLERILAEFYRLSESEIICQCVLLASYHAVYRRDRLMYRRQEIASGKRKLNQPCLPPTPTQLQEIAHRVNAQETLNLNAQEVLNQLQNLANYLHQYRRHVKAGLGRTDSGDELNHRFTFISIRSDDAENNGYVQFLQMYPI